MWWIFQPAMAQLCVTLWFSLTWLAGWNGWTRIFQMYLQLNMGKFQPAMLVYQRVINFKMEVDGSWKMIFLSNWVIFRFLAINFQECMKKTLVRFEKNHRIRRPTALVISATGFRTYMFPNTCILYIYLGSTPPPSNSSNKGFFGDSLLKNVRILVLTVPGRGGIWCHICIVHHLYHLYDTY